MTRKHLYEGGDDSADQNNNVLFAESLGLRLAKKVGFKKARVGVARKLAAQLPPDRDKAAPIRLQRRAPPGRMARIRPTHLMPIIALAVTRARSF